MSVNVRPAKPQVPVFRSGVVVEVPRVVVPVQRVSVGNPVFSAAKG
ncbi:hypothetical protein SAMN04487818_10576 [Actinokineospora terrae]|uniref:Uncharacterized protein n=1 Tax=Actinokineospora terrae TaxID=155974 RepID=A0A1H9RT21_9PSEU|nr:hypothetical protein SAMN04487818_10576 [Actinokineospora terrae]